MASKLPLIGLKSSGLVTYVMRSTFMTPSLSKTKILPLSLKYYNFGQKGLISSKCTLS